MAIWVASRALIASGLRPGVASAFAERVLEFGQALPQYIAKRFAFPAAHLDQAFQRDTEGLR